MIESIFNNKRAVWIQYVLGLKLVRWLISLDIKASDSIERCFRKSRFLETIKFLSNTLPYTLAIVLLGTVGYYGLDWGSVLLGLITLLFFSEFGLKKLFKRKRPYYLDGVIQGRKVKNFSFPSSHSLAAGYIVGAFVRYGFYTLPWFYLVVAGAVFIPFSRVALNVHFISDVVVGFVFGLLGGVFWG